MSVKRIVDTNFWNDDKVVELFSPEDKLFMLYLMTNPHTTQLGIYAINKKIMAFEIGYSIETISVLLERFENKYKMIKYSNETNEIAIKNYLKYSIIKGGKPVEDCLEKEIKQVKDKDLLKYVFGNLVGYDSLNITVSSIIDKYIDIYNINDNDNDNDNDNEVSYHDTGNDTGKQIIDYLNLKTNKNYKYTTNNLSKIKARLKENFTIDDFKEVIDKKCLDWLNDKEMNKYLRPETLFGNKFESYLQQDTKQITTRDLEQYMDFSDFRRN